MINLFNIKYSKKFPFINLSSLDLFSIFFISLITGILGFILETFLAYVETSMLTDRGFLCGPFIPIYFIFAFLSMLFFKIPTKSIKNFIKFFFVFAILITLLEFITGNILELFTHSMLWDYSAIPLSYKYISFLVSFLWGICASFYFMFIVPFLYKVSLSVTTLIKNFIIVSFITIFLIDLSFTLYNIFTLGHYQKLYNMYLSETENRFVLSSITYYIISVYLCAFLKKYKCLPKMYHSTILLLILLIPIIYFIFFKSS